MTSKPKTTWSLGSPYANQPWPVISHQNQLLVLDLLIDVLTPIGQYRAQHVIPSKGKRAKRKAKRLKSKADENGTHDEDLPPSPPDQPTPEILKHVALGFNSTMRHLESLAQESAPTATSNSAEATGPDSRQGSIPAIGPFAIIFVPQSDQSSKLFAHLPLLIRAGNINVPDSTATRLVILPKTAEGKLSAALGIRRVGVVGVAHGAPMASELIDTVRAQVPICEVPWLEHVAKGLYLPVNIQQSTKTEARGAKRKKGSEEFDEEVEA